MEMSFEIQGDSEGFVTFECPFCDSEFKLQAGEYQDENNCVNDLFCPYCGLTDDKNKFISKEVIEKAQALAYNYMSEQLNDMLRSFSRSVNSKNNLIKVEYKPLKQVNVKELIGRDTAECEFGCKCCTNRFKVLYCSGVSKVFCPYCGVDI